MRGFLLVSGALVAGVALLFAVALSRAEPPTALEALPLALRSGAELHGAAAQDAFDAWVAALPPAPLPLTVDLQLRGRFATEAVDRLEVDLDLAFGDPDGLRLDLVARSAPPDGELRVALDGSLAFAGGGFWAWGELPARPELRPYTEGRVVRLPEELLDLFLQEGALLLDAAGAGEDSGPDGRRGLRFTEILHPARLGRLLIGELPVIQTRLDDGELEVVTRGAGKTVQALLAREATEGFAAALAQIPARFVFDAATGMLLGADFVAEDGDGPRAELLLRMVRRESSADAARFQPPENHQVFDLEPVARAALPMLRRIRERAGADGF